MRADGRWQWGRRYHVWVCALDNSHLIQWTLIISLLLRVIGTLTWSSAEF
uniref:Uncharacterized protein n=1 Tax=Physcomitrium patens TaxID=3218 RepID=A0A2K1JLC1_PHYPA|nr:hypothetical protein PHYPA_017174 [Physcomitrium patens]